MSQQTKALLYQKQTQIYLGKKSPFLPRSTKQELSGLLRLMFKHYQVHFTVNLIHQNKEKETKA